MERDLYVGIDAGAIQTKMVLYKPGEGIIRYLVKGTTVDASGLAESMLSEVLGKDIPRDRIATIVATGQGRRAIRIADLYRTEITCFARGAYSIDPGIDLAVDLGGHGIRTMKIGEMGIISDFRTNDKCSSGTGCFLDATAKALNMGITDLGCSGSCSPERINATCTIFAESEVISLVAKGKRKEDIVAGLNGMVARRVAAMINSMRSEGRILIGGGVALNSGVTCELKRMLDREVIVPERPDLVGALGAALMSPGLRKGHSPEARPQVKRTFWDRLLGVEGR
jgi:predicted CoA-substrate-specific enzyme activase